MKDIMNRNEVPSASSLTKTGLKAIGYGAAGIFLIILNTVTQSVWPGLIVGAIVCLFGFGSLRSRYSTDRKAGIILTTAGALTILSKTGIPLIAPFSSTLLGIGAVGLLVLGIWNAIKFVLGLKKRS